MDEHKRQALEDLAVRPSPGPQSGDFGRVTQVEVTEGRGAG
jgi:hypothetical protein